MRLTKKALIISVGGSLDPIVTSINYHQPDFICFLASKETEKTIEEKTSYGESILSRVCYSPEYQIFVVTDVDDIDVCFEEALKAYNIITEFFNNSEIKVIVDYTGGTKTMSVALVFLALLKEAELYFSSGRRKDAYKVIDGTEIPQLNTPWMLFWKIKEKEVKELFDSGLYFLAEKSIVDFADKFLIPEKRDVYLKVRKICLAFNAWDAFKHKEAKEILEEFRFEYKSQLIFLEKILGERRDATGYEKVVDLFYNALRRKNLNRYDDAVCRLYRAIEMLGQLRLKNEYSLDSSDIDLSKIKHLGLTQQKIENATDFCLKFKSYSDGKIKLSLTSQFQLLSILGDSVGMVYSDFKDELRDFLKYRNFSILAHGQEAVSGAEYKKAEDFAKKFINTCLNRIGINLDHFEAVCRFELKLSE